MKTQAILGALLLVLGLFIIVNSGISYRTREKIIDIGPIEADREVRKTVPISPVVGVVALAGGATLIVLGMKRAH